MEELITRLHRYGRLLELEDSIPHWEQQRPELLARVRELKNNGEWKQIELSNLEEPNFFQRVFGRVEEKKEKLHKQVREITAAHTAAKWELEDLERKLEDGKQELEALSGSREAYARAKQEAKLTAIQESQLMMQEIAAFTPVALAAAERVIDALEEARPWMRKDANSRGVAHGNRKMEFISLAAANARKLVEILSIMPEGCAAVGSYLRDPANYIDAVTSEFKKLDRLNNAIDQVRETRNQLRMLQ